MRGVTLEQVLAQAAKLASIGELAGGMAHEINNPIGYVNCNLSALESYINDNFGVAGVHDVNFFTNAADTSTDGAPKLTASSSSG